jgi:hypothetical protein
MASHLCKMCVADLSFSSIPFANRAVNPILKSCLCPVLNSFLGNSYWDGASWFGSYKWTFGIPILRAEWQYHYQQYPSVMAPISVELCFVWWLARGIDCSPKPVFSWFGNFQVLIFSLKVTKYAFILSLGLVLCFPIIYDVHWHYTHWWVAFSSVSIINYIP